MKANEFQCAMCGGVFNKGRSEAECLAELEEVFPGIPKEECDEVCDPCWKTLPCSKVGFEEIANG